jgi:hypothetical protein
MRPSTLSAASTLKPRKLFRELYVPRVKDKRGKYGRVKTQDQARNWDPPEELVVAAPNQEFLGLDVH